MESKQSLSGLKPLDGQLLSHQAMLVAGRHRKELWVLATLSRTGKQNSQAIPDAGKQPSALFALAFAVLRLAFLTMKAQAKVRFYTIWCRTYEYYRRRLLRL